MTSCSFSRAAVAASERSGKFADQMQTHTFYLSIDANQMLSVERIVHPADASQTPSPNQWVLGANRMDFIR